MEKIVEFTPAFDKRHTDPNRNYGIHGVDLRMVLKGMLGAVQFVLYTNWQLPHVQEEIRKNIPPDKYFLHEPFPADLGYHSPKPIYEGQAETSDCLYLNSKSCYYDGSSLNAKPVYNILLSEGSDGVWTKLEEYYIRIFGELV